MQNILKIFLIIFCFVISLTIPNISENNFNVLNIYNTISVYNKEHSDSNSEFLTNRINENENSIVSSNITNYEISASQDKEGSYNFGTEKNVLHNRLLCQNFINKYSKITNSISHKISSYLKNEICTRAP